MEGVRGRGGESEKGGWNGRRELDWREILLGVDRQLEWGGQSGRSGECQRKGEGARESSECDGK